MRLLAIFSSFSTVLALASGLVDGGKRILVLSSSKYKPVAHPLAEHLADSGYTVVEADVKDRGLSLSTYGDYVFDTVLLIAPDVSSLTDGTGVKNDFSTEGVGKTELIRYVDDGGNLLIAGAHSIAPAIRTLTNEFALDFFPNHVTVDSPSSPKDNLSIKFDAQPGVPFKSASTPALAIPSKITPVRLSPTSLKVEALLVAPTDATVSPADKNVDKAVGSKLNLVAAMQTDVGSRVTVLSTDALLDVSSAQKKSFVDTLISWAAKRSHVLRMSAIRHRQASHPEGAAPQKMYREGSDVHAEFDLEERKGDDWVPYMQAKDVSPASKKSGVQVAFTMIDPYIRTVFPLMPAVGATPKATYGLDFRVPDKCGIFKFVVGYKEPGTSKITYEQVLPIRNFKHDDAPRFVLAALPYYLAELSTLLMTVFFVVVFLYHKESNDQIVLPNLESSPASASSNPLQTVPHVVLPSNVTQVKALTPEEIVKQADDHLATGSSGKAGRPASTPAKQEDDSAEASAVDTGSETVSARKVNKKKK